MSSDTKVISTIFEIIARQAVFAYAEARDLLLKEPEKQNHYPDFTLMRFEDDSEKIAIDVKTTYRKDSESKFGYTLGSYTSYIHPQTEAKNIVYPYSHYGQHWVIGFVYRRTESKPTHPRIYSYEELADIQPPFEDVEFFIQEKWKIAGDRAGSGNTNNIGSIRGVIDDFVQGNGIFLSETEFVEYWKGYGPTEGERKQAYSCIEEYREKNDQSG